MIKLDNSNLVYHPYHALVSKLVGGNIESLQISPRRPGPDDVAQTNYALMERGVELPAWEVLKLAKSITPPTDGLTDIKYITNSLQLMGRYNKSFKFNLHLFTLLLNNQVAVAICPGELFVQFELDYKKHMQLSEKTGFFFGIDGAAANCPDMCTM